MSKVTSNDAVPNLYLADLFDGLAISIGITADIFDRDVTTAVCSIVIDGTKGEVIVYDDGPNLRINVASDEDAAAGAASHRIARDGAIF
jgi:hypothetical protein